MKYEFINIDSDTTTLKYKNKEFTFTRDLGLMTKIQNINFDARNQMVMDLAKKGMTVDDLKVIKKENGKRYEDERNIKEMEKNYVLKCSLEVFDEICYKNTGMSLQEILNDIGLKEQQESEKFGSDLRQAIFGTSTPR